MSNSTCPSEYKPIDPVPFYSNGSLNFKAHDVGWIVSGFFTLIASCASFWLIWKHLTYYTCPQQQRHIVRMLFMVPIYAVVSLLSYVFYHEAIYYQTIRDCYEAVVITSFFYLLLQYIGDTPAEQHEVFRMVKMKKWFFPLGFWKYRPEGLHFLWIMKISILQYAIVRPVCTLVAVGLQYYGLYCLESWAPHFGHIYISIAISISVSIAMYCVIQFYLPIQTELKPYSPVLKFLAVKSVVFLTFWQDSFLSILVYFGAIKESQFMSAADIQVGINALLETFEMMLFAFLHIKAFTYLVYRPHDRTRVTMRFKALLDVLDFRDWYYQMRQSTRYMTSGSKGREFSLVDDIRRQKFVHLEQALGRDRWLHLQHERDKGKVLMPSFWKNGCEPSESNGVQDEGVIGNGGGEKKYIDPTSTSSEMTSLLQREAEAPLREPRSNAAMRPDYNPEDDVTNGMLDDEDSGGEKAESAACHGQDHLDSHRPNALVPTLPKIDVQSIRGAPSVRSERHPELASHHYASARPALESSHISRTETEEIDDADRGGRDDGERDIFVPRKGGRARKEPGTGVGAFWRTFQERISGSEAPPSTQVPSGMISMPKRPDPQSSDAGDNWSSRSRIRFTEIRPPRPDPKDDPEADIPSYNGFVVAGKQSLQQVRARQSDAKQNQRSRQSAGRLQADEEHRSRRISASPATQTSRGNSSRARHSLSALQTPEPLSTRSDDRDGPFGAARAAIIAAPVITGRSTSGQSNLVADHRSTHAATGRHSLAVGAVVTRREMAEAMTGEPAPVSPPMMRSARLRNSAPPNAGGYQVPVRPTAWPRPSGWASQMPPYSNGHPQQQWRQTDSSPNNPTKPANDQDVGDAQRRSREMPARATPPSQTRPTPTSAHYEPREAREGFHFDYLD